MILFRLQGALPVGGRAAFLLACLGAAGSAAQSELAPRDVDGPDFTVGELQVVQTIPGVSLIGGKPVVVRATVPFSGRLAPGTRVDGLLRVYVDGREAPFSPVFSDNGPIAPPAAPSFASLDETLNFVCLPPVSSDVVLVVEVNPAGPGQVHEANHADNTLASARLAFECARRPELVYVAIDYRPSNGPSQNLPDPALIEPGVGDAFLQGIFPSGDWDYRASDVPTKLWTSSLNTLFAGTALLDSLLVDLALTSPRPDFIYGWVPGGLFYNGQANGTPGQAAMGNTLPDRHQRTLAHEIGHCFGRPHVGNRIGVDGVDVEHHLNLPLGLPRLKPSTLFDVMVPGLLTHEGWIYPLNHERFADHPAFDCSTAALAASAGPSLLVAGLWERAQGRVTLTHTVALREAVASAALPLAEADLLLRVWSEGTLAAELGLRADASADCARDATSADSALGPLAVSGFMTVLPASLAPSRITRLAVVDPTSGSELARLERSAAAPRLALAAAHESALAPSELRLGWSASDPDGGALRHYVRYSPDGARRIPLAAGLAQPSLALDLATLPRPARGAFLEVLTSDGLHTVEQRLDARAIPGLAALGGSPPTTHLVTPDSGQVFPRGASVLLHASGWDLEDRSLDGASIVWSSSIDGIVASGRVTSTARLSVGAHVLTVRATDSDGLSAADTALVTITDRLLPGTDRDVLQTDLGFGGPGGARLVIAGGDLSRGTTADVLLTGLEPGAPVVLVSGASSNPTAILGGTLVPAPPDHVFLRSADPFGNLRLNGVITGGGGPAARFVQAVHPDPSSPSGFGFSNAVRVDLLP